MEKRVSAIFQVKITMAIMIIIIGSQMLSNPASAGIDDSIFDEEFDSGVITGEWMNMSYAWVQTNETALLSLASYDDVYKVAPFHPFFGQRIEIEGKEYFVGNIIAGFELYEDLNDNHILDSQEELSYYIMLNASQNFIPTAVEQTLVSDRIAVYSWKYSYMNIDGFLSPFSSSTPPFVMAKTVIDSFNLTFAFAVTNKTSELKLSLEMGKWDTYKFYLDESFHEIRTENINLDNYGLSILFGTTISSTEPVTIVSTNVTSGINSTFLQVNDTRIFDLSFTDNYDLGINGSSLPSFTAVADINSLYSDQITSWNTPSVLFDWWNTYFPSISNLPTIPPLGLDQISFLYRICYPVWSGIPFHHDPRYRAYFTSDEIFPITITTTTSTNVTLPVSGFLFLSVGAVPIIRVVRHKSKKK